MGIRNVNLYEFIRLPMFGRFHDRAAVGKVESCP